MVEQHGREPSTVPTSHGAAIRSRIVKDTGTEASYIWVDPMLHQGRHALEVAVICLCTGFRAADWLNQHPVPSLVRRRPIQMPQRQVNNLRAPMVGCRPSQFTDYFFTRVGRKQLFCCRNIMKLSEHIRMYFCSSLQQQLLERFVLVD